VREEPHVYLGVVAVLVQFRVADIGFTIDRLDLTPAEVVAPAVLLYLLLIIAGRLEAVDKVDLRCRLQTGGNWSAKAFVTRLERYLHREPTNLHRFHQDLS
jgi:hypothetical protein